MRQTTLRCAVYVRVSSSEQAERYGPETQRRKCKDLCSLKGWEVAEVYEDLGHSGATMQRPGLERLLADTRNDKWDTVVCYKVDRLSRSVRHLCAIWEDHLAANGKGLASCEESFDTGTPMGRFFLKLLGTFGEMEREMIRERTEGGRRTAVAKGRLPTGQVPFGYVWDTKAQDKQKALAVAPDEADWVRQVFEWYVGGDGSGAIAERLAAQGVPSKHGGAWRACMVCRILRATCYVGELHVFTCRRPKGANTATRLPGPGSEGHVDGTWVPVPCPAIVDRATWEKAQAIREGRVRHYGRYRARRYLLARLATCATCGAGLQGATCQKTGYRYYRCGRHRRAGAESPDACPMVSVRGDRLEAAVKEVFRRWASSYADLREAAGMMLREGDQQRRKWQAELAKCDDLLEHLAGAQKRAYYAFVNMGAVTEQQYRAKAEELAREIGRATEERDEVKALLAQADAADEALAGAQAALKKIRRGLAKMTDDDWRPLFEALGLRVLVQPDGQFEIRAAYMPKEASTCALCMPSGNRRSRSAC